MMKINKHIEIVRSSVEALSSLGLESSGSLLDLLKHHYAKVTVTTVNDLVDLKQLVDRRPDLVFVGMKYVPGPNGKVWVSGYLDQHDINHTGSPQTAVMLEQDKSLAKQRILDAGLKTAAFMVIKNNERFTGTNLPVQFPLFVKPTSLGGGEGIDTMSVVHDHDQLMTKVSQLSASYSTDILIEEYLPGREFSVAILAEQSLGHYLVMPVEKTPPPDERGQRILSNKLKKSDSVRDTQVTDQTTKTALCDLAMGVFTALGAQDYGRIDIRLDNQGVPHFLEANLVPGIRSYSTFAEACWLNEGISYQQMILRIVELGLRRQLTDGDELRATQAHDSLGGLFEVGQLVTGDMLGTHRVVS